MDRSNPYESAFEAFLKEQGLCYVAVDETRRAVLGDVPVKNLDFIVLGPTGAKLLVDVKGRQFPGGPPERPRYVWESWATQEDVNGLTHWQALFGADYQPLFVFMYHVLPSVTLEDTPDIWRHKDDTYLFRAVTLDDYRQHMRVRSPKWGTVNLPKGKFEEIARPFRFYSHECPASTPIEESDGPDQARHLSEITRAALQAFVASGAKLGASAIELEATGELAPKNLTQTGRREITHLLRSHDLAVSAIVCPLRRGLDVAENLDPRLEQIREAMALAFDLGPRLVIIPIGKIPDKNDEPRSALLKESLEALGKHGDRTGVVVALEAGLDDPAALVEYLGRFDHGSLGINFNPANLVLAGFNPYDAVRTFGIRLAHAHAQDARRVSPSKIATVPLGHGDLDWLQLLAHFEEIAYRGFLTVLGVDAAEMGNGVAFLRRFVA